MLVQSKTICMGTKLNMCCSAVCQVIIKYTRDVFTKTFKILATTLDQGIHKQPLLHVQRKVFFHTCDFAMSMIKGTLMQI